MSNERLTAFNQFYPVKPSEDEVSTMPVPEVETKPAEPEKLPEGKPVQSA